MDISPLQRQVRAAELPLDRLASNSNVDQQAKIGEVARQFEAVLLRQILAQATKQLVPNKLSPPSAASSIYQDMVVNQLADTVSHANGLGLGNSLAKQLSHQLIPDSATKAASVAATPAAASPPDSL